MWIIEKIRRGVLKISTETGLLYVEPSLGERLKLLWTFRNFRLLPEQVLTNSERKFIGELCSEQRLRKPLTEEADELTCVIGTVDMASPFPKKRPKSSPRSMQSVSSA